jgi:hypothetical protein
MIQKANACTRNNDHTRRCQSEVQTHESDVENSSLDAQGSIFEHYSYKGSIVNFMSFSEMLREKMNPAVRAKRGGLLQKVVRTVYDRAQVRTSSNSVEGLRQLNSKVVQNLPYSLDLINFDNNPSHLIKGVLEATGSTVRKNIKKQSCVACHSTKLVFSSERIQSFLNCKFPGVVITYQISALWRTV